MAVTEEQEICPRCTGRGPAHYLTCPVLNRPPDGWLWTDE
jgi:hypothetical protein